MNILEAARAELRDYGVTYEQAIDSKFADARKQCRTHAEDWVNDNVADPAELLAKIMSAVANALHEPYSADGEAEVGSRVLDIVEQEWRRVAKAQADDAWVGDEPMLLRRQAW